MPLSTVPGYGKLPAPLNINWGAVAPIQQFTQNVQDYGQRFAAGVAPTPAEINTRITGDPRYTKALAQSNFAGVQSRDALRQKIRDAVMQGGWDITGKLGGEYAADVDPATLAAAQANPLSQKNVLQRTLNQGLSDLQYALAARGMLRSGALGAGSAGLNQNYQEAANSSMNDLVNALHGGIDQYTQFLEQQRQALAGLYGTIGGEPGIQAPNPTPDPFAVGDLSGVNYGAPANVAAATDYWRSLGSPTTVAAAKAPPRSPYYYGGGLPQRR